MNSQAHLRPFTITLIHVSVLQNVHKTRANSHSQSLSFLILFISLSINHDKWLISDNGVTASHPNAHQIAFHIKMT